MSLFDQIVEEALKNQPDLASLRLVVEKELLHHDILRILSDDNLLNGLTFIGGTCLRICYGGIRLSEDLDFTGGNNFSKESLSHLRKTLIDNLNQKYGLHVSVDEPIKDVKNVNTWKIKIITRPEQKYAPSQRIHIDICTIPSYEKQSRMLLNPYGVDMGTTGLVVQAQSCDEIFLDKLLAFALRPNRLKYRDLWDIVWLYQQSFKPSFQLLTSKLKDHKVTRDDFFKLFDQRYHLVSKDQNMESEFKKEMQRFFSPKQMEKILEQNKIWSFILYLLDTLKKEMDQH